MTPLTCALCGYPLSPTGQDLPDGYKLLPDLLGRGTNQYVHRDNLRCLARRMQKRKRG